MHDGLLNGHSVGYASARKESIGNIRAHSQPNSNFAFWPLSHNAFGARIILPSAGLPSPDSNRTCVYTRCIRGESNESSPSSQSTRVFLFYTFLVDFSVDRGVESTCVCQCVCVGGPPLISAAFSASIHSRR